MAPLPPNLSRIGDDLEAATALAIAARRARREAFRRALVVALVAVPSAVLIVPGELAPLHRASMSALTPAIDIVWDDLATDEATVAAVTLPASSRQAERARRGSHPGAAAGRQSRAGATPSQLSLARRATR